MRERSVRWFILFVCAFAMSCFALMPLDECREKAAYGDAEALYELGVRYEKGDGVRQDPLRAISHYRRAADKKHRAACRRMVEIYSKGLYVARDEAKASYYAELGGGAGATRGGGLGEGSTHAEQFSRQSAEDIQVAICRIRGTNGYAKDVAAGTVQLYMAAKNGNKEAQRCFVEWLDNGELDPHFRTSAEGWRQIDAWRVALFEKGVKRLGLTIGRKLEEKGKPGQALRYYEAAASAGVAEACLNLAILYWCAKAPNGKDYAYFCSEEKAMRWFKRGLELARGTTLAGDIVKWLIIVHTESKRYYDVKKAFALGKELYATDRHNASYVYFYAYAGIAYLKDAWRRLNLISTDRQYEDRRLDFKAQLEKFLELAQSAVAQGQKDIFGILKAGKE